MSDRPKSKLPDGKANPEYVKWYRLTYPEKVKATADNHAKKRTAKRAENPANKRGRAMKGDVHTRRKIAAMLREGWKQETIVTVLMVPQSVVQFVADGIQP